MEAHELEGMNGRRALIEGVIVSGEPDGSPAVLVRFGPDVDSDDGCAFVPYDAIREILHEPIKAGDRVKTSGGTVVTVLGAHGDEVWVAYPDDSTSVWFLSDLTLVEPGQ